MACQSCQQLQQMQGRQHSEKKQESALRVAFQQSKNNDLVKILKNCVDHTLQMYKFAQLSPKIPDTIHDVVQYSKALEKMLKKLVSGITSHTVPKSQYERIESKCEELRKEADTLARTQKDYKCQIDVLEKRLLEAEESQSLLIKERNANKKFTQEFDKKVTKIKRESEQGLRKIIEVSRSSHSLHQRKGSLPIIKSYDSRQKLGLLFLMDSPGRSHKTTRLVDHLRKKY